MSSHLPTRFSFELNWFVVAEENVRNIPYIKSMETVCLEECLFVVSADNDNEHELVNVAVRCIMNHWMDW